MNARFYSRCVLSVARGSKRSGAVQSCFPSCKFFFRKRFKKRLIWSIMIAALTIIILHYFINFMTKAAARSRLSKRVRKAPAAFANPGTTEDFPEAKALSPIRVTRSLVIMTAL